jgi:hypothetical protein
MSRRDSLLIVAIFVALLAFLRASKCSGANALLQHRDIARRHHRPAGAEQRQQGEATLVEKVSAKLEALARARSCSRNRRS